jgi:hypothetical protein
MPKKKIQRFKAVTESHYKAMQWCLKNNIKVYVKPTKKGLKVEINDNDKINCSPIFYTNTDACNKCWELYLYIYKKYWTV